MVCFDLVFFFQARSGPPFVGQFENNKAESINHQKGVLFFFFLCWLKFK